MLTFNDIDDKLTNKLSDELSSMPCVKSFKFNMGCCAETGNVKMTSKLKMRMDMAAFL